MHFILVLISLFIGLQVSAQNIHVLGADLVSNNLTVKHDSMGDIKIRKRIYDSPPRLVLDVLEAELGKRVISYPLPLDLGLKQVRIAQFDPTTVRIVVDAQNMSAIQKIVIDNIGHNIVFKFGVTNVTVQSLELINGNLQVVADGPIVSRSLKLETPSRLVVDLIGAQFKSPSQAKTINNGQEVINISQFDNAIVRISFTGKDSQSREIKISNNEKQLLVLSSSGTTANNTQPSEKLSQIQLLRANEREAVYQLDANKKIQYKHMRLHDPERLVVDIIGLSLDDAFGGMAILESNHASRVRFGLAGPNVSRIVFDLRSVSITEIFKEANLGKSLIITLQGLVPKLSQAEPKVEEPINSNPTTTSNGPQIVLDPGHGGYDYGAIYGGYNEKDITLSIAKKVSDYLSTDGIQSFMTRNDDRFVSLAERVEISNALQPKAFISIHVNAIATNPAMDGLQTYYSLDPGHKLAEHMHAQLLKHAGMPDRRIRHANFWVCKHTRSASVLLELGFMTNVPEREKLASNDYQDELAKAIVKGIKSYLEES